MTDVVKPLGWEVVNWMGTDSAIDNVIGTLFAVLVLMEILMIQN